MIIFQGDLTKRSCVMSVSLNPCPLPKSLNLKIQAGNHINHVVAALLEQDVLSDTCGRGYASPYLEAERLNPLIDS